MKTLLDTISNSEVCFSLIFCPRLIYMVYSEPLTERNTMKTTIGVMKFVGEAALCAFSCLMAVNLVGVFFNRASDAWHNLKEITEK